MPTWPTKGSRGGDGHGGAHGAHGGEGSRPTAVAGHRAWQGARGVRERKANPARGLKGGEKERESSFCNITDQIIGAQVQKTSVRNAQIFELEPI
jgi:hypothetical protein